MDIRDAITDSPCTLTMRRPTAGRAKRAAENGGTRGVGGPRRLHLDGEPDGDRRRDAAAAAGRDRRHLRRLGRRGDVGPGPEHGSRGSDQGPPRRLAHRAGSAGEPAGRRRDRGQAGGRDPGHGPARRAWQRSPGRHPERGADQRSAGLDRRGQPDRAGDHRARRRAQRRPGSGPGLRADRLRAAS